MRCPSTLSVLLILGAPFWGASLACAAQPEAQTFQAEVSALQPATYNATAPGATSNATAPGAASNATAPGAISNATAGTATVAPSPSVMEEGPAMSSSATPAQNATTLKKNATSRASSPAPSAPARPAAKPVTNGTSQQSAPAKRTPTTKQPAHRGNATQEKTHHTQNGTLGATGEKDGWVVIEQGTRPVYAGIHGGTVPLTVLRASNGALFALAGETGSDFMNVLRGNTTGTGRGAAAQASLLEEEKKAGQPNDLPPQPLEAEIATQQAAGLPQIQAEKAQPASANQEQVNKETPGKEQNAPSQAKALQPPVPPAAPVATANSTAPAAAAKPLAPAAETTSPAPAEITPSANTVPQQEEAKQPPKDPMVAKLLGIPPPESDLVIASSDLANRLKNANADLAPFGLTADLADQDAQEQAPAPKPKPTATLPKLTLGSYKDVLKLR